MAAVRERPAAARRPASMAGRTLPGSPLRSTTSNSDGCHGWRQSAASRSPPSSAIQFTLTCCRLQRTQTRTLREEDMAAFLCEYCGTGSSKPLDDADHAESCRRPLFYEEHTETPERQAQIRALLHSAAAAERDERRTVALEKASAAFVSLCDTIEREAREGRAGS